ncbi:DUF1801 domain-containing protein [Paenibacillus sp. PL91]|uniref:DUF1801 domain-containing protein n=1 Tax=Paenibacillus sp. PL91 TaxID=2729538 RepID=UPI00145CC614|nr:DUF1801 domain-containing protein [Paenibacillus sp. PL91]MBC9201152.1 DUF1801 domain-containing protein [Paenibacillus sp. PL91]
MTTNNEASNKAGGKSAEQLEKGHQQVVAFLNKLEHPLKPEIEEVRNIILSANTALNEHIKWNAPSFQFQHEDRFTFNLQGKGFFRIIFHSGAKVKDNAVKRQSFNDATELLEWVADDRAFVKFTDMEDVQAKKDKLVEVISRWLDHSST